MGKKQVAVSLRKPPPADPDAFVAGGTDSKGSSAATAVQHASEGPTVMSRVGERRELTVYLPTALARQLSLRCVELDRDVSGVVAEALLKTLAGDEPPPQALPAPARFDRWSRARELVAQFRARLPRLGVA